MKLNKGRRKTVGAAARKRPAMLGNLTKRDGFRGNPDDVIDIHWLKEWKHDEDPVRRNSMRSDSSSDD